MGHSQRGVTHDLLGDAAFRLFVLRRGYNWNLGADLKGNIQAGLTSASRQQNIHTEFEAAQSQLINERMTDHVQPSGDGYFIALADVKDGCWRRTSR